MFGPVACEKEGCGFLVGRCPCAVYGNSGIGVLLLNEISPCIYRLIYGRWLKGTC